MIEVTGTIGTDAGMCALWNPMAFWRVSDYDSWEKELLESEDIARHIRKGHLVPLNLGEDAAYGVAARICTAHEPAALSDREKQFLFMSSDPYLFRTARWRLPRSPGARLSGVEHVERQPVAHVDVPIPPGRWAVTVHSIAWDSESVSKNEDGSPAEHALPDFVVLINPEGKTSRTYRTSPETFDRPPSSSPTTRSVDPRSG